MPKSEILDIMKTSGPAATGLTFILMPQLFENDFRQNLIHTFFSWSIVCWIFIFDFYA